MATSFWPIYATISKMAISSVVCVIIMQSLVFEIEFVLSGNSPVTLPYTRDKGALPWLEILELKLLYMHFYER